MPVKVMMYLVFTFGGGLPENSERLFDYDDMSDCVHAMSAAIPYAHYQWEHRAQKAHHVTLTCK